MVTIATTLGPKTSAELGLILPHEHIFVDLRTWDTPGYALTDAFGAFQEAGPSMQTVSMLLFFCSAADFLAGALVIITAFLRPKKT